MSFAAVLLLMFPIAWIGCALWAAAIAEKKGRSVLGFFFLALLLSPLVGLIVAAIAMPHTETLKQRQLAQGTMKKCPFCAEPVKLEATICRFCQRSLAGVAVRQPSRVVPDSPPPRWYAVLIALGVVVMFFVLVFALASNGTKDVGATVPLSLPRQELPASKPVIQTTAPPPPARDFVLTHYDMLRGYSEAKVHATLGYPTKVDASPTASRWTYTSNDGTRTLVVNFRQGRVTYTSPRGIDDRWLRPEQ